MKKCLRIILLLSLPVMLLSLSGCSGDTSPGGKVERSGQGESIYNEKMNVEYSKNFSIEYFKNYKIISIYSPDEKRNMVFQYVLLPEGTEIPGGYEKAMVVRTPVKSAIVLTSLYVGFFEKLDMLDKIIAVDKFQYVNSAKAKELIKAGRIHEAGESFSLNIEKIFELKPDIIFTYGNGNPEVDGNPKILANGLKVASTTIHLENSPLARAEWIKFFAAFSDHEKEANLVFDAIAKRYNGLVERVKTTENRPTVFTEALFGGMWYEPGGKSFMSKLLKDAGADYIWKDDNSTGSLKLTYEQVYLKAHDADYWVNVHFWTKFGDALKNDPRNSKFKAYRTKNIYNYNALANEYGYYEYWENGVINCDLVLSDLVKIFHPEILPDYNMTYYRKLTD